jgi:hypothetical protein
MGGAYGCFIQFNHITGNFALVSYRDPQITKTFDAYSNLHNHINNLELTPQVMEQLIIGTYGSLDPHQAPSVRGAAARNEYLAGITKDFKQKRIDDVLATTPQKLKQFAPLFESLTDNCFRTTIGSCDKIRSNSDLYDEIIEL